MIGGQRLRFCSLGMRGVFDKILTKSAQILTIYVKNHEIHVNKIQECHFLKIKKSNVQNHPRFGVLGYWGRGNWGIGGELINY